MHLLKKIINQIIASSDKVILNFRSRHYGLLFKYLGKLHPLSSFNFKEDSLPKLVSGFKRTKFWELYSESDLKQNPKSAFFRFRYQWLYRDKHGRLFHFKWSVKPMVLVGFEFIPSVEHGFDYSLILSIIKAFKLDYRDFLVSRMEHCWDFHGKAYKNIMKSIWSKCKGVGYAFSGMNGVGKFTNNFLNIPNGASFTAYLGQKGKNLHIKAYTKTEGGSTFDRIEADVCRSLYGKKGLRVNNLDDLYFKYRKVVDSIFNSFCLLKINRKKFTDKFPNMDRWFNERKEMPLKQKAEELCAMFPKSIRSITEFRRDYMEKHGLSDVCKDKLYQYFEEVFFADIDSGHLQSIKQENTKKRAQRKLELKTKKVLAKEVKKAIHNAKDRSKVKLLFPVWQKVLNQIKAFLRGSYPYLGYLNGLIISLKRAKTEIAPDFDEMKGLKVFRERGIKNWRDYYDEFSDVELQEPSSDYSEYDDCI